MKFVTDNLRSRVGHITWGGTKFHPVLETPLCLLYTRCGSIPHLTPDLVENLTTEHIPLQISLDSIVSAANAIDKNGASKFVGFGDRVTFLSIHDTARKLYTGYNDVTGVALWTNKGRNQINVEQFSKIVQSIAPDWVQALSDGDTTRQSSLKRIRKSVDRSLKYLDQYIEKQNQYKNLENCSLFGCIEGGFDLQERTRSARETAARNVEGFILDGFCREETIADDATFGHVENIIADIIELLPRDKPRIIQGAFSPHQLLLLVEQGIDIFDSTYPYVITENGWALDFSFVYDSVEDEDIKKFQKNYFEQIKYSIDLNDKKYASDLTAIVEDCDCIACRTNTRAYIHHLLITSELLAKVLLMTHNLHHFFKFLRAVRRSISKNELTRLKVALTLNGKKNCKN